MMNTIASNGKATTTYTRTLTLNTDGENPTITLDEGSFLDLKLLIDLLLTHVEENLPQLQQTLNEAFRHVLENSNHYKKNNIQAQAYFNELLGVLLNAQHLLHFLGAALNPKEA